MQYVPKNKAANDSSTKTNSKEIPQEEKKKVVGSKQDPDKQRLKDKADGRSNRFYPPKDRNQQQTVGNKKIPYLPESELSSWKKKKSRKLSRETAYY